MSNADAAEPRPTLPFPGETAPTSGRAAAVDVLLGDWSLGLSGPPKPHNLPAPTLLGAAPSEGSSLPPPARPRSEPSVATVEEPVESPDDWRASEAEPEPSQAVQLASARAAALVELRAEESGPAPLAGARTDPDLESLEYPQGSISQELGVIEFHDEEPAASSQPALEAAPAPDPARAEAGPEEASFVESVPPPAAEPLHQETLAQTASAEGNREPAGVAPAAEPAREAAPTSSSELAQSAAAPPPHEESWLAAPEAASAGVWESAAAAASPGWVASEPAAESQAESSAWTLPSPADEPDGTWAGPVARAAEADGTWAGPVAAADAGWGAPVAAPSADWSMPAAAPASSWTAHAAPPSAPEVSWTSAADPAADPASDLPAADPPAAGDPPPPGSKDSPFGSLPIGASLSDDEEIIEDPDLPVAVEEIDEPAQPAQSQVAPALAGLELWGEHRVAVHTRGGNTKRGVVRNVDLAQPQFSLQPQGGGSAETVSHAEVKAIFFMLPPGEKAQAGSGERVRVTFPDGRTIEGNRDGTEGQHGFFLVPADAQRTNTRRIYVARDAVSELRAL